MLKPDIPQDQLERIQPIVEQLLAELHRLAAGLGPQSDLALIYQPEIEGPR
jgi:hypothetical protein